MRTLKRQFRLVSILLNRCALPCSYVVCNTNQLSQMVDIRRFEEVEQFHFNMQGRFDSCKHSKSLQAVSAYLEEIIFYTYLVRLTFQYSAPDIHQHMLRFGNGRYISAFRTDYYFLRNGERLPVKFTV